MTGQRVIFTGIGTPSFSESLWVTDGTTAGTLNITPASASIEFDPEYLASVGDDVVFAADDYSYNIFTGVVSGSFDQFYVSNGTAAGTIPVGSVNFTGGLVSFGNEAIFDGSDAEGDSGLWITDGTVAGTKFVTANTSIGNFGGGVSSGAELNATHAVFIDPSQTLWITDGTAAGTKPIPYLGSGASELTSLNGKVLFIAEPTEMTGSTLWITDGTSSGTHELMGTDSGKPLADPVELAPTHRRHYADDGADGRLYQFQFPDSVERIVANRRHHGRNRSCRRRAVRHHHRHRGFGHHRRRGLRNWQFALGNRRAFGHRNSRCHEC